MGVRLSSGRISGLGQHLLHYSFGICTQSVMKKPRQWLKCGLIGELRLTFRRTFSERVLENGMN
jgi:hypothetical protein